MAKIIDGKAVSAAVRAGAKQEVEALKAQGIQPGLAVVIVGDILVQLPLPKGLDEKEVI